MMHVSEALERAFNNFFADVRCEPHDVFDLRRVQINSIMEVGSERISTPIRSPSDKDSVILSRASGASSPFGFRKVGARSRIRNHATFCSLQHLLEI